jgi:hypothetical protein
MGIVSRDPQDPPVCWRSATFTYLALYSGNLDGKPMRTKLQLTYPLFFSFLGKRRGMWSTNTGLDLRIWSSASPVLWHSQPWSAGLMAIPTHPRLVFILFFFVVENTPSLLVKSQCPKKGLSSSGSCTGEATM